MKISLSWLPFVISTALNLVLQGPGLWASLPNRGDLVELGDLKSPVPADWVEEKPDDAHRYKQYRLEPVADDKEDAQLTIDWGGKENGDSTEKQVERWKAMFRPPEGRKLDDVAKVRKLNVSGAVVTYLDVRGDYKGIPGNPATPRQNYRLLGVYFATPQRPYLIRVLGPTDTVEFYRKGFEHWVKAFK